MNKAEKIIHSLKRNIRLTFIFYIIALILLLLLGNPVELSSGSEEIYLEALLPPWATVLLIIFSLVVFLVLVALQYAKVDNLLFRDCDPQLYLAVQQGVMGKRMKPTQKLISNMTVAHLTGDFATAAQYSHQLLQSELNLKTRFAVCSDSIETAYFMKDTARIGELLSCMEQMLADPKTAKDPFYQRNMLTGQIFYALIQGEYQKATELLTQLEALPKQKVVYNVQLAGGWLLSGMVYYHAGEKQKAIHAFMNVTKLGGSTFMTPLGERYLELLK